MNEDMQFLMNFYKSPHHFYAAPAGPLLYPCDDMEPACLLAGWKALSGGGGGGILNILAM